MAAPLGTPKKIFYAGFNQAVDFTFGGDFVAHIIFPC